MTNEATTVTIKNAHIKKGYNTIGSVQYTAVFLACEGNYVCERSETRHKSEALAIKKLRKLHEDCRARYGSRLVLSADTIACIL